MDKHVGISFTDKLNPFISWMSINKIADSCVASIPSFGVTWRLARKSLYNIHTIYSLQECNSIICQHLFSQKGVVPLYTSKANCTFCTFFLLIKDIDDLLNNWVKKSSNSDGQSSFIRNVKDFRRLIATWAQDSSASLYQKELPEEKLSHGWVFGGRRGRVRWKPQHHGASSCSYWC